MRASLDVLQAASLEGWAGMKHLRGGGGVAKPGVVQSGACSPLGFVGVLQQTFSSKRSRERCPVQVGVARLLSPRSKSPLGLEM